MLGLEEWYMLGHDTEPVITTSWQQMPTVTLRGGSVVLCSLDRKLSSYVDLMTQVRGWRASAAIFRSQNVQGDRHTLAKYIPQTTCITNKQVVPVSAIVHHVWTLHTVSALRNPLP